MKKKLWVTIIAMIGATACALCLSACKSKAEPTDTKPTVTPDTPQHTAHTYVGNVADEYKLSDADCTHKAVYYMSCSVCGEKSSDTFDYGEEPRGHDFTAQTAADKYKASDATCTHKAAYYKSCAACGISSNDKDKTFEFGDEPRRHDFTAQTAADKYKASDADCTHKATYYKSCSACGISSNDKDKTFEFGDEPRGHDFTAQTAADKYKASDADCTHKATYYKSCSAYGISSNDEDDTFEFGDTPRGHDFTAQTAADKYKASDADCTHKATYYKSCSACGLSGNDEDDTFEFGDTPRGHSFGSADNCEVCYYHRPSIGLEYGVSDGEAYLIGRGTCADQNVFIADMYNGYPVTRIASGAFSSSTIKSVVLPQGIRLIGKEAFSNCSILMIDIPDSVIHIESFAFYKSEIMGITLPDRIKDIGYSAFLGCKFSSVTIGKNVTSIENAVFAECRELTSVTISKNVKKISESAFFNCAALSDIHFDGSIAEWHAIDKDYGWDFGTGNYFVHCSDGEIRKGS